jgi:hypothetical protein
METHEDRRESNTPRNFSGTSFFTRRLANKLEEKGIEVPQSFLVFMDTPMRSFNKIQAIYFEQKVCRLFPSFVATLEEVFKDLRADEEGWEDMVDHLGKEDTPIKICATAVLIRKWKEVKPGPLYNPAAMGQHTKKIEIPPQLVPR